MTSRERVVAALNHIEGDMVPIDLGGTGSSGINIIAYNRLKKYLDSDANKVNEKKARLYDLMQQLAEPEFEVLDILKADVVQLYRLAPRFNISVAKWKPSALKDGSECLVPDGYNPVVSKNGDIELIENGMVIGRMPKDGYYFDIVGHPHGFIESKDDVDKAEFPVIYEYELSHLETRAKDLFENTEYAIVGAFGGSLLESGQRYMGFEKFLMDLIINKRMVHRWLEKMTEHILKNMKEYLSAVGRYINVIQFSDDLGTQNSLMISKETYKEMLKSYHTRIYQFVRQNYPDIKVLLHSCGAIYELIPDLIEAGVQVINPVQVSAKGMDPCRLKKEFGRDIIFWGGGADMQHTVNYGSIDEIKSEVKRLMNIFKPGGGYVFTQVHNIQENILPEKILAIYNAANETRCY